MLTIRVADRGQRASFSRLPEIRLHTINGYTRAFVCRAIVQFVSSTSVEASTARISGEPYLPTRFDKYVPWSVNRTLSVDAELIYFSSFPLDLLFFSLPGERDNKEHEAFRRILRGGSPLFIRTPINLSRKYGQLSRSLERTKSSLERRPTGH